MSDKEIELPPKSNVGVKPTDRATDEMREGWRRYYFERKAEREAKKK